MNEDVCNIIYSFSYFSCQVFERKKSESHRVMFSGESRTLKIWYYFLIPVTGIVFVPVMVINMFRLNAKIIFVS